MPFTSVSRGAIQRAACAGRGVAAAWGRWTADLFVPPACVACRTPLAAHDALCAACWREVKFIRAPLCDRLGMPLPFDSGGPTVSARALADPPDYDRARAVAHCCRIEPSFDGVLRELVHQFKYGDNHNPRRLFGRWLHEAGAVLLKDADLIIPVPMNRWRLLARRFNQAAVLANELGRLTGVPWTGDVLMRTRRTPRQVGLSRDQRRRNMSGAFAVAPRAAATVLGKSIVLVDDVITTGATLDACARALKRAGALRVDALALGLVTGDSIVNP